MQPTSPLVLLTALTAVLPAVAQDWLPIPTPSSPGVRNRAVMVTDAAGVAALFGGVLPLSGTYPQDTWTFDGTAWTNVSPAIQPSARTMHAMAHDVGRGRIVLYGGYAAVTTGPLYPTDTWEWDGTSWTRILTAHNPGVRPSLAMAHDQARGRTIAYGGWAPLTLPAVVGTWEYDGVDWVQMPVSIDPGPRREAAMAYLPGKGTVLCGGLAHDETWVYDGASWTPETHLAHPPEVRLATLVLDPGTNELVLFGGTESRPFGTASVDRTWHYDAITGWRELHTATRPGPRTAHASGFLPGHGIVVNGGYDTATGSTYGDTWVLAGTRGTYSTWGAGCQGSTGVVTLTPQTGSVPDLGATLRLDLDHLPTAPGLFAMVSTFAAAPTAIDLSAVGMTGCYGFLAIASGAIAEFRAHAGGVGSWSLAIPAATGLLGVRIHQQALSLDPGAPNPASAAVSNAGTLVIGQ
ncbi:MAG: hypothetical protein KDE27_03390 [Planctomycetes bacterium]|nr:hypothetical protein [Planctomycetota bacterium]